MRLDCADRVGNKNPALGRKAFELSPMTQIGHRPERESKIFPQLFQLKRGFYTGCEL